MEQEKEETIDLAFRSLIAKFPEGEKINLCFQCGTCSAGCPTARIIKEYNPRRLVEDVLLGFKDRTLSSDKIWLCTVCHTCLERCPQGIPLSHIFMIIKNLATVKGNFPEGLKTEAASIIDTGLTASVTSAILRRRDQLALPKLPSVSVNEIQEIVKATKFDKLVGYEWKKEGT